MTTSPTHTCEEIMKDLHELVKNWRETAQHADESDAAIFELCANELEFIINRKKGAISSDG